MCLAIPAALAQRILYPCNRTRQIVLSGSPMTARNVVRIRQEAHFEDSKVKRAHRGLASIVAFIYDNGGSVRKLHKSFPFANHSLVACDSFLAPFFFLGPGIILYLLILFGAIFIFFFLRSIKNSNRNLLLLAEILQSDAKITLSDCRSCTLFSLQTVLCTIAIVCFYYASALYSMFGQEVHDLLWFYSTVDRGKQVTRERRNHVLNE